MVFIQLGEQLTETKQNISLVHYMPLHPVHGLGKTEEELEQEGILIEELPEPEPVPDKVPVMFWNPQEQKVFYEYVDRELSPEEKLQQQIDALNIAIAAIVGGAE